MEDFASYAQAAEAEDYKLVGRQTAEDLMECYLIKHAEVDYFEYFVKVEDHVGQEEKD